MTDAQLSNNDRAVQLWLFAVAALVFAMIVVGGATRLTDSGLSITEWKPIMGAIPPLTDADWQDAFAKYRQIPEYHLVNKDMSLDGFKFIFWWEWAHRFLGRFIGFVFALPLVVFWATGRLRAGLGPKLLGVLALGGLQGAIGWYMVSSGLVDRVDVSQYRLALHLSVAFLLFALLIWTALSLNRTGAATQPSPATRPALLIAALLFLQVILGAFVAGTKAGSGYNTWPTMNGQLIPDGLFDLRPWYHNLTENLTAIQFNHRMLAYLIAALIIWHAINVIRSAELAAARTSAIALKVALLAQIVLGIFTVLYAVPLSLGLLHQAGAAALFGVSVWHLHQLSQGRASA